ncbi:Hypothetical protein R9X50_00520500 [Acrodontium crateriforme]|uniref:Telomere length regulation protein conserved domain-containing protein n=1 Tax=Acrodontium crateriforme TaxID=150365 RepID=A0AAQ3MCB7_9PEZI|nr:Hypothetical protein R9X50_00520500 [Acrodontium crateriforme]
MDDFLTVVKTVNKTAEHLPVLSLTAVHSRETRSGQNGEHLTETPNKTKSDNSAELPSTVAQTPQELIQTLRSEPNIATLEALLRQLLSGSAFHQHFNINTPGPNQSQIINTLLTIIIPNFWNVLDKSKKALLALCLSNISGINALIAKLRSHAESLTRPQTSSESLSDLLDVISHIIRGDDFIAKLWQSNNSAVEDATRRSLAWKEIVNLLGSGKIVAAVAQAEYTLNQTGKSQNSSTRWLGNGQDYSSWLGQNIAEFVKFDGGEETGKFAQRSEAAGQILLKSLALGYPARLINSLMRVCIHHDIQSTGETPCIAALIGSLPLHGKRKLLEQVLKWGSENLLDAIPNSAPNDTQRQDVSALAGLLIAIIKREDASKQHLLDYITDPVLTSSISLVVRRAAILTLLTAVPQEMSSLLEKIMSTFGDSLFINHAPVLQQDMLAQSLLLTAGYLHRTTPMAVLLCARSTSHMQDVSNRLDSSVSRARWLGMAVGTALSSLVDKEGLKMNFGTEDMKTAEAKWYLSLVKIEDKIGTLSDLDNLLKTRATVKRAKKPARGFKPEQLPIIGGKQSFGPPRPPQRVQTELVGDKVMEIDNDDTRDDSDDLKPYAKPDSDPEDSDEDATLVNRNKVKPPVYIRTLMAMLRDDQNHDRFQMGIQQAAKLIRRKANFGSEVKDHAEEILKILCNLQDPFDTDNFDELRLQAMIAVLLSDFLTLGPGLSRQAFAGEYSLAQRCIMLSALGLGGRELAGLRNEDELNPVLANIEFPSKRLPLRLHAIYRPADYSVKRLESASKNLEHQLIQPMALKAADQSTKHLNAVKVHTFSSRLQVERTKRKPAANQLAKIFGPAVFFPLTSRYQQDIAAYGSGSVFSSAPFVLVTLMKTLALLLHAAGPAILDLPQITAEYWDFLLSLRVQAASDKSVLEALLFSFLTLLEVNTDKRRIADDHAKHLMETQKWVELVFERTADENGEGSGEEAKVRALLAGVSVKIQEVIEVYQKQTFGQVL